MFDDAIVAFKKVVSINPKSEKAHSLLFTIYDKLGRGEEAMEEDRINKQLAQERRVKGFSESPPRSEIFSFLIPVERFTNY